MKRSISLIALDVPIQSKQIKSELDDALDTLPIPDKEIKTELDDVSDALPIQINTIKTEPDNALDATVPILNEEIKAELDNSGEESIRSQKDYEEIWKQLNVVASDLASSDKQKEVNDIVFVLSQDPDKFTFFDIDYDGKVHSAIKETIKLLFSNGKFDPKLSEYLWLKRNEFIKRLDLSCITTHKALTSDWNAIHNVALNLFKDIIFHIPKPNNQKEVKTKRLELGILLSTDPSLLRNQYTSLEIGTAKIELAIAVCTHILDGVKKQQNIEFRQSRNKKIRRYWNVCLAKTVSSSTFWQVRCIVTKYWRLETDELQIEALTILLIMDIKMLQSNYLLFNEVTHVSEEIFHDIECEVEICIKKRADRAVVTMATISKTIDCTKEISMPIIVDFKKKQPIKRLSRKIKSYLRQQQLGRTDLALIGEFKNLHMICGDLPTFEWLRVTMNKFSSNVTIDDWTQLDKNDFKEIILLSPTRLTKSFDAYMALIKTAYPHLRTNLWMWLSSASQWQWRISADVQSIAYLEQYKRRLEVENSVLKFDVRYVDK